MKKGQVDVAVQRESSTDSTQSAREVNSTPSRRKRTRNTETSETRAEETTESSAEKKASPPKVASKKSSKTKSKPIAEKIDSVTDVDDNLSQQNELSFGKDDARTTESQDVRILVDNPFPNESQFDVPYDVSSSSDRFFCSDEEFLRDKFDADDDADDFDDDFDEDFIQLDDMEFNESLDEPYDEGDDPFEYSDEDMDSDPADDDFDKLDSDENLLDDADEDYPN